jgi:hypothetical protein
MGWVVARNQMGWAAVTGLGKLQEQNNSSNNSGNILRIQGAQQMCPFARHVHG